MRHCRDCTAPVRWVRILRQDGTVGEAMPIDRDPDPAGNIVLTGESFASGTPLAKIVQATPDPDQLDLGLEDPAGDQLRFLSHFVHCPAAEARRKR